MPIQESYRQEALSKLKDLCQSLGPKVKELLEEIDREDLEFGIKLELRSPELNEPWKRAVEENNYMEVAFTEIMEHHDGAYLKTTFRNSLEDCHAERYVSIRSSGRVEIGHAFFLRLDDVSVRVERVGEGLFRLYAKVQ
ncbi:MAG: hypothetical protein ACK4LT_02455 [Aquificaceae bacterium]